MNAKYWKQPKFPHMEKWLNKPHYINTMEQYAGVKKKNEEDFCELINFQGILLNGKAQCQRVSICYPSFKKQKRILGNMHASANLCKRNTEKINQKLMRSLTYRRV